MLATLIIVFREVLEAALVVSIVLAASTGIPRRGLWIGGGLAGGLVGAALVAAFAQTIAMAAEGLGQELFNALVLYAAVVMLGWHVVWMSRHGQQMAQQARETGRDVLAGRRPLSVLALVVGLAVLREGSEVVLFTYGIVAAGGAGAAAMLLGGLLGVAAGVGVGAALYFGLLRIPARHLFSVTNAMVLLLAAGMASQGAAFLVQAGLLPPLGVALWDTSSVLSERSLIGQTLHTLIGYAARPDGIQVLLYGATLAVIGMLTLLLRPGTRKPQAREVAAVLVAGGALLVAGTPARAAFEVHSPVVVQHEVEAELSAASVSNAAREDIAALELAYSPTAFWSTEVELAYERSNAPGEDPAFRHEATAWENVLQLTEQGAHFVTVGLFAEYEWAAMQGHPNEAAFGPLLQAELGRTVNTLNLLAERQVGANAGDDTEVSYAWQTRWRLFTAADPGFEVFGGEDQQLAGPVVLGSFHPGFVRRLKYDVGYLAGLNDESPNRVVKARLELEF